MKTTRLIFTMLCAALLIPRVLMAGTLDDAPFQIVVPSADWKISDSKAQPMGKDVFLVASISNTNTFLKSVVIKTILTKETGSSLDELCAGIRDTFSNPVVKKISEADSTFLGHRAKTFTYLITQGDQTTYNEATVFVADGNGWTIACVGRPEQKSEIKKIISIYRKSRPNQAH